jgi:hypothetical protein
MHTVTINECFSCDSTEGVAVEVPAMQGNTARTTRQGYTVVSCADCGAEQYRTQS